MQTYTNYIRVGYYTVLDNKLVHTHGRNALPPLSGKFHWLVWLTCNRSPKLVQRWRGYIAYRSPYFLSFTIPCDDIIRRHQLTISWNVTSSCDVSVPLAKVVPTATDLLTMAFDSIDDDDDDNDDTFVPVLRNTPAQQTEWRYSSAWR